MYKKNIVHIKSNYEPDVLGKEIKHNDFNFDGEIAKIYVLMKINYNNIMKGWTSEFDKECLRILTALKDKAYSNGLRDMDRMHSMAEVGTYL